MMEWTIERGGQHRRVRRTPDALRDARPQLADIHAAIVREMLSARLGGKWCPDLCGYFAEASAFETFAGIREEFMRRR
jgi:hypothetical protein